VINLFVQKLINFFPTEKIPQNKLIKFFIKLIYFLIRNFLTGPFIIKTKFFKIYAYPQKKESSSIYYRGFHEYDFLIRINNLYDRNSKILFLDVGANVGNNTLSVSNYFKNLSCYSFEPHPKYFEQLKNNVKLNSLKNVRCFDLCIGNSNKKINFYLDNSNPGGASVFNDNISFHTKLSKPTLSKIETQEVSLDEFLKNIQLNSFDNFFLKIDVEGGEKSVLDGAFKFIKNYNPDILLEIEEKNFSIHRNLEDNLKILKKFNYNFYNNFLFKVDIEKEIELFKDKLINKKHFHYDLFITKKNYII